MTVNDLRYAGSTADTTAQERITMGMRMTPEQQAAAMALPGATVGKSMAELLAEQAAPVAPPPADDADEVREFMPQVIKLAKRNGWQIYHVTNSRRSEPGWPDLVMLRAHEMIVAELKSINGKTTPAQDEWLEAFSAVARVSAYVRVFVWKPSDWPEIVRVLGGQP